MKQAVHSLSEKSGVHHKGTPPKVFDLVTGNVAPVMPINKIVGLSEFGFDFFNEGGTNNLLPGRPTTQTASIPAPEGAGYFITCRSFSGAFVTDGGTYLTERPLGKFKVDVFISGPGELSCTVRLSDSNGDDPVKVSVRGILIYFV